MRALFSPQMHVSRLEKGNHTLELTYFYRSGKMGEGILRQGSGLELKYSLLGNGWMNQVRARVVRVCMCVCVHARARACVRVCAVTRSAAELA